MTKIWQGEFRHMVIAVIPQEKRVVGMHQVKVTCTDSMGDVI